MADPEQPAGPQPSAASTPAGPEAFVEDTPVEQGPPALREAEIQNAIAFLSHPKVRGSAETAKRAFLEKKGLTSAEIDEAFKRVPPEAAPAPAAATGTTPVVGANNLVTYTQPQQQQQPHQQLAQQPQYAPQHVAPQALVPAAQLQVVQRPPMHWSQVVLGLGVAAAGLYGMHQLLAPRLSAWTQQLFSSRKAAADAEAARNAALLTALERLAEGQVRMQEALEGLTAAVKQQQQQQPGFGDSQADYLACASPSLGKRPHHEHQQQHQHHAHQHHHHEQQQHQPYGGFGSSSSYVPGGQHQASGVDTYASSSRAAAVRGGSSWDPYAPDSSYRGPSHSRPGSAASPRGVTPGPTPGPSGFYGSSATGFEVTPPPLGTYKAPQPPAQYQQQRGEQYGGGSSSAAGPHANGGDPGYARRAGAYAEAGGTEASGTARPGAGEASRPEEAPRSAAFHEVMAMVQAGITPPNVRTDIDDNPPDPNRPLSAPQLPPRAKPWEASTVSSNGLATPGAAYSSNNAVVPDGPAGFGVRGYGGGVAAAAAAASPGATPTSAPHSGSSRGPAAATAGTGSLGDDGMAVSSSSRFEAPAHKSGAGCDLSQLLGPEGARDTPWRPPPPPAATVPRPSSSGSTSKQPLAAADSAPPAPPAAESHADAATPAPLPAAASAPPAAAAAEAGVGVEAGAAMTGTGAGSSTAAAPEIAEAVA